MRMLTLKRVSESKLCTMGVLIGDDGIPICVTLENPWKNNKREVSCILEGSYTCYMTESPKYGKCYEVSNVYERSHILIHAGNIEAHTKGGILLGSKFGYLGDSPAVLNSKATIARFEEYMCRHPFILEIEI